MNVDLLEKALRQPKPFTLHLTDGRHIDVPHPEFLWLVLPNKTSLVVSYGRTGGVELLRVNQIGSIFWPDNKAA